MALKPHSYAKAGDTTVDVRFTIKPQNFAHLFTSAFGSSWATPWITSIQFANRTTGGLWLGRRNPWRDISFSDAPRAGLFAFEWRARINLVDYGFKHFGRQINKTTMIYPGSFYQIPHRRPDLFYSWTKDNRFDANVAQHLLQLACFGDEVFT